VYGSALIGVVTYGMVFSSLLLFESPTHDRRTSHSCREMVIQLLPVFGFTSDPPFCDGVNPAAALPGAGMPVDGGDGWSEKALQYLGH
jgi:hypothetical protein